MKYDKIRNSDFNVDMNGEVEPVIENVETEDIEFSDNLLENLKFYSKIYEEDEDYETVIIEDGFTNIIEEKPAFLFEKEYSPNVEENGAMIHYINVSAIISTSSSRGYYFSVVKALKCETSLHELSFNDNEFNKIDMSQEMLTIHLEKVLSQYESKGYYFNLTQNVDNPYISFLKYYIMRNNLDNNDLIIIDDNTNIDNMLFIEKVKIVKHKTELCLGLQYADIINECLLRGLIESEYVDKRKLVETHELETSSDKYYRVGDNVFRITNSVVEFYDENFQVINSVELKSNVLPNVEIDEQDEV